MEGTGGTGLLALVLMVVGKALVLMVVGKALVLMVVGKALVLMVVGKALVLMCGKALVLMVVQGSGSDGDCAYTSGEGNDRLNRSLPPEEVITQPISTDFVRTWLENYALPQLALRKARLACKLS